MALKTLLVTIIILFMLGTTAVSAGGADTTEHEQIVIALSTDDFELAETDMSDMEVGDSQTINTDSGKRIDLLRTQDGVEIYVDGELIDAGVHGDHALREGHKVIHKHVEVICDTDEHCDENIEMEAMHHEGVDEKIIIIKTEVDTD
jgi:hypothetical protein